MAHRFEVHSTLDPIPPTRPIPAGHTPAPGTPAASALEVRNRLARPAALAMVMASGIGWPAARAASSHVASRRR